MAEGKRSVIIYSDLIHTVKKMSKEKAGILFMTILEYINDLNPEITDETIDLVFEPIKQQMKRDLKKWESIKEKRSGAGKASAEARRLARENEHMLTNSTHVNTSQQTSTNPTVNVNGNVTVNDNVNEINNIISDDQKKLIEDIAIFFEYTSPNNHVQQSLIWSFVYSLPHKQKLEFFIKEFPAYCKLKELDGYKHKLENFLGDQKEQFKNGKWDDNWSVHLAAYKKKNNITDNKSTGETALQRHRRKIQEREANNGK